VGTGSGYQAAVLSHLCAEVYTIEIIDALALPRRERLQRLAYQNVFVRLAMVITVGASTRPSMSSL